MGICLVLEYEFIKTIGPAGMGLFALYLITEKIVLMIKSRIGNNGISNARLFEIIIEIKSEMKTHTDLLRRLVDKQSLTK